MPFVLFFTFKRCFGFLKLTLKYFCQLLCIERSWTWVFRILISCGLCIFASFIGLQFFTATKWPLNKELFLYISPKCLDRNTGYFCPWIWKTPTKFCHAEPRANRLRHDRDPAKSCFRFSANSLSQPVKNIIRLLCSKSSLSLTEPGYPSWLTEASVAKFPRISMGNWKLARRPGLATQKKLWLWKNEVEANIEHTCLIFCSENKHLRLKL